LTTLASVVEGGGEVLALPVLVRRIADAHGVHGVRVIRPFLLPRSRFLVPEEFERAIEIQARRVDGSGGVLALLDADDDCAFELTKQIRATYRGGRQFSLLAAVREYESLFLAGKVARAEEIRDAKSAVRALTGAAYKETRHQAKLTATVDLDDARQCRWFRKLESELLAIFRI
jgi:hypothetical protein